MSEPHEYPPCTGQCCQGLALATERLDAAQAQLYANRVELQAANVALGEARSRIATIEAERDELRGVLREWMAAWERLQQDRPPYGFLYAAQQTEPLLAPATVVPRSLRYVAPAAPVSVQEACETWCSLGYSWRPPGTEFWAAKNRVYCTAACRDAGRPLHPRKGTTE